MNVKPRKRWVRKRLAGSDVTKLETGWVDITGAERIVIFAGATKSGSPGSTYVNLYGSPYAPGEQDDLGGGAVFNTDTLQVNNAIGISVGTSNYPTVITIGDSFTKDLVGMASLNVRLGPASGYSFQKAFLTVALLMEF